MPFSSNKISQRIEAVCEAGCEAVRASIQLMEQGIAVELTQDLNEEERKLILNELKSIMSVYDKK